MSAPTLSPLERGLTHVENAIAVLSLSSMTVLVCGEVLIRTLTRPESKVSALLGSLFTALSGQAELSPSTLQALDAAATLGTWGVFFGLTFFALWSSGAHAQRSPGRQRIFRVFITTAVLFAALWLALQLLLYLFPQGIPDARALSLGLMVWAALVGASIAIREDAHIQFGVSETIESIISPRLERLAPLFSALFCALFAFLSSLKLFGEVGAWLSFPGAELFASSAIPTWTVTLALPVAFSFMSLRFLLRWRR